MPPFFAPYFYIVFGAVTLLGGIMGYVKARSVASLAAGGGSGVMLVVAGYLLLGSHGAATIGVSLGLVVSLLLLGRFLPALLKGKTMPAAIIVPLALVGTVLAIVLLVSGRQG